jgi:hypothetical protein
VAWASRRRRDGLVSPRAVPRFHRDGRHSCSPGRGRDRSCDDDHNKEPYPYHDRGAETCFAGTEREGGRERNRWLVDSRARSFPGLHGDHDDPQEDDQDPRESLQNMDVLLKAGRIPCFRLLSRRRWVCVWGLGPLAQQRKGLHPRGLGSRASSTRRALQPDLGGEILDPMRLFTPVLLIRSRWWWRDGRLTRSPAGIPKGVLS